MNTRQAILQYAAEHPEGFKSGDLSEVVKGKTSRKSVMLWQLKKDGALSHDKDTGVYKLIGDLSTAVNKTSKPAKKAKRVVHRTTPSESVTALKDRVKAAEAAAARLLETSQTLYKENKLLREQLTDALAIIRYLEDKLFKAIQHDARKSDGNA